MARAGPPVAFGTRPSGPCRGAASGWPLTPVDEVPSLQVGLQCSDHLNPYPAGIEDLLRTWICNWLHVV